MSKFDPYEHLGIRLNSDGTLNRLSSFPKTDANPTLIPGFSTVSKDVIVNSETKVCARIFLPAKLPSNDNTVARLPIVFFFHSGGFVFYDAANISIHQSCSDLASQTPAIVVSVDYRLAPEHRLPTQYEDAVDAILWVKKQSLDPKGENWLRDYGDFTRCHLCGRGSGGNIAFHAALRVVNNNNISPLKIKGIILNQPLFGGKQRTPSELKQATDQLTPLPATDLLWELALPTGTDRDHLFCNPMADEAQQNKISSISKCLLVGFGEDPISDRLQELVEMLVNQGVQVEARFDEEGFRDIDLVDVKRSQAILNIITKFISSN